MMSGPPKRKRLSRPFLGEGLLGDRAGAVRVHHLQRAMFVVLPPWGRSWECYNFVLDYVVFFSFFLFFFLGGGFEVSVLQLPSARFVVLVLVLILALALAFVRQQYPSPFFFFFNFRELCVGL